MKAASISIKCCVFTSLCWYTNNCIPPCSKDNSLCGTSWHGELSHSLRLIHCNPEQVSPAVFGVDLPILSSTALLSTSPPPPPTSRHKSPRAKQCHGRSMLSPCQPRKHPQNEMSKSTNPPPPLQALLQHLVHNFTSIQIQLTLFFREDLRSHSGYNALKTCEIDNTQVPDNNQVHVKSSPRWPRPLSNVVQGST